MEIWKPCPSFCNYEASSLGRIRSISRLVQMTQSKRTYIAKVNSKILSPYTNSKHGYYSVTLHQDGKMYSGRLVHRIVCEAFYGPCPKGMEVAHNNGIRTDNRAENLRWCTRKENHKDKCKHGTSQKGDKHGMAKLTQEQVSEIKRLYKPRSRTHGSFALAKLFNVHRTTIENVVSSRNWKD